MDLGDDFARTMFAAGKGPDFVPFQPGEREALSTQWKQLPQQQQQGHRRADLARDVDADSYTGVVYPR